MKIHVVLVAFSALSTVGLVASFTSSVSFAHRRLSTTPSIFSTTTLFGKKAKRKGGGGGKSRGQQAPQEKKSVQDARFDAQTRQFMFTLVGLTKVLPDKSKTILKNINLSFYPGAKIGVVGLNGSGKSSLLKIMAGVDKEFDGVARALPGASVGYLPQEPELECETVQECIDLGVASSQAILDEFNELSMKLADPDLSEEEMNKLMAKTDELNNQIEASNLWELDRIVSRAMDALRVPPGDAKTATLSGGEKRRVALCRLLLSNHDMLLLDEPTNHLGVCVLLLLLFVCVCLLVGIVQFVYWFIGLSDSVTSLCLIKMLNRSSGWNSFSISSKEPWFALHMTATSLKTWQNGSSNSIAERVFHMKAIIRHGCLPKTSAWQQKRKRKRQPPRPWSRSWNGFAPIQRPRETRVKPV